MNALIWNCRGLGLPRTVQELTALVRAKSLTFVFLCETRISEARVANLRWRLGLRNCITMDSNGGGGGLALFWHESVDVTLMEKNPRFIDVATRLGPDEAPFRITFVYGEPRTENRHHMWEALRRLRGVSDLPWLVVGDFNEVMWGFEHFSECARPERHMAAFREVLGDCDLTDLGFSGLPYTYDNGREARANVKVRLDRAVADTRWRDVSPEATLRHLVSSRSDHCPLFLEIKRRAGRGINQGFFVMRLCRSE